jgi:hypothetical protein
MGMRAMLRDELTNPQILRRLTRTQIFEELRVLSPHLLSPLLVVLEDAIMALLQVLAHLLRFFLSSHPGPREVSSTNWLCSL